MTNLEKVSAILSIVQEILAANKDWVIVDHWPDDLSAIGIAHKNNERRLVYISSFNKKAGLFDYQCEEPNGNDIADYTTIDSGEDVNKESLIEIITRHLSN